MNDQIPQSVVTGRRVAMTLLVVAMVLTVAAFLWLIASSVTEPVAV